jgi:hypothetical protein
MTTLAANIACFGAALGTAPYHDPQSEHLAGFGATHRKRAIEWFARDDPFRQG